MSDPGLSEVPRRALDHEKLKVYQLAKQLDALAVDVSRRAARGNAWLLDQLQRASMSVCLNIVEANGRSGADRRQHFLIARGSANEVDGAFELLQRRRLVSTIDRDRARLLVTRIVGMLTTLAR